MGRRSGLDRLRHRPASTFAVSGRCTLERLVPGIGIGIGIAARASFRRSAESLANRAPLFAVHSPIYIDDRGTVVPACCQYAYHDWQRHASGLPLLMLPFAIRMGYWCGDIVLLI